MTRPKERLALVVIVFLALTTESQQTADKLAIACEGGKAKLNKCLERHVIQVVEAWFGRKETIFCGLMPNSSHTCGQKDIRSRVKALCEGENSCQLSANTSFLGEVEGCTYAPKYLLIYYKCVKEEIEDEHLKPSVEFTPIHHDNTVVSEKQEEKDEVIFSVRNSASSVFPLGSFILLLGILGTF